MSAYKQHLLPVLVWFAVFIFYSVIVTRLNIHGDAKFHTLFAKESAEEGELVSVQPYRIFGFQGNQRIYMPIAYPLTSESLFSLLYTFGQEKALIFYSPLMASLAFLFVYLIFRDVGNIKATIISLFTILVVGERFIMTPLIEPYVLVMLLGHLYFLKEYFRSFGSMNAGLSAFFLSVAAAIKQQGLVFSFYIVTILSIFTLFVLISRQKHYRKHILNFILFVAIFVSAAFPAINDQIGRTGTFAFSPGRTELPKSLPLYNFIQPLVSSKYDVDPKAMKALDNTINYNKAKLSLPEKFRAFLMSPFLFYRASDHHYYSYAFDSLFMTTFLFVILAIFFNYKLLKEQKYFWVVFIGGLLFEVLSSYILKTPVNQYHILGVTLTSALVISSFMLLHNRNPYLSLILFSFLVIQLTTSYTRYLLPLWKSSGREDEYHLNGYKSIGDFVRNNTPDSAIFLAGEVSFRYYTQRDTVWLNENIGDTFWDAVYATNDYDALKNLAVLKVDYIMINNEQTKRRGVSDYLPPNGLASFIKTSPFFTKTYDPYNDGQMAVYKVNYSLSQ